MTARTNTEKQLVEATRQHVRLQMSGECTGHDWWHVDRVWRCARHIWKREGGDLLVIELAALLHDIADWKFHGGSDEVGPRVCREWLESLGASAGAIERVCTVIREVSFKGARTSSRPSTLEGMIVQDSDRLDAMGAIGVARAFAYGGAKGQEICNPDVPVRMHESYAEYKSSKTTTVNHFHEKLLLLRDAMNTGVARELAHERHELMVRFLERFREESQQFEE